MSDLFAPLREPEPVSRLAPEEVRRRGDGRRRRRTGLSVLGAMCVTALLVGGTSLIAGERMAAAPDPAETPDSVFPEQFDIADGLPRYADGMTVEPMTLNICGRTTMLAEDAIGSEGMHHSDGGDLTARGVSVYPDAGTARTVAAGMVARYASCPTYTGPNGRRWTIDVRSTEYGDQSWMMTLSRSSSSGQASYPEVIHVVRLGASILVTRMVEIHLVSLDELARWTGEQVEVLLNRQMCLLTEEGCAWRSDPDVLRPDGWGPLQLGMSREAVESSGVAGFSRAGECTVLDLDPGVGYLSDSGGLVRLQVPEGVTTPDGIGLGSGSDEVLESYLVDDPRNGGGGVMVARASPGADYEFTVEGGEVTRLALSARGDECGDPVR